MNTRTRSLHFFFLITNQKSEKPPEPATTVEPVTMPAIAPPESPSLSSSSPSSSVLGAELPTLEPPELPLPASPAGTSSFGITISESSVPSSAKFFEQSVQLLCARVPAASVVAATSFFHALKLCASEAIATSSVLVCSELWEQTKVFVPTAEQVAGVVTVPSFHACASGLVSP